MLKYEMIGFSCRNGGLIVQIKGALSVKNLTQMLNKNSCQGGEVSLVFGVMCNIK